MPRCDPLPCDTRFLREHFAVMGGGERDILDGVVRVLHAKGEIGRSEGDM